MDASKRLNALKAQNRKKRIIFPLDSFCANFYWLFFYRFTVWLYVCLSIICFDAVCEINHSGSKDETPPLVQLSLEELLHIEVVTVSKKTEPITQAAAAVFVITQD
ncbi:hypothetical protein K8I31_08075, partial [bacterium]|nr:hypothetical protein [bacterium]